TGGNMSFGKTINSDSGENRSLTVSSTGDISITGAVGGTNAISVAALTGKNVDIHSVHSTRAQTYTATTLATINGNYVADNGAFKITGNTSLGGGATVNTTGTGITGEDNDITFTGTINGNHTLNLAASGKADVVVSKANGGTRALGGLSVGAQTIDLVSVNTKKTGVDSDHTGVISLKVEPATTPDTTATNDDKGKPATSFKPTGTIKI